MDRTGHGDLPGPDLLAVDEELARSGSSLAGLEIRRSGHGELPAQGRLPFRNLGIGDDLELLETKVVVRELQLLLLVHEEGVAAEAAAMREQHAFAASLRDF